MKNKSFFTKMMDTVSWLPWLKGSQEPVAKQKKQKEQFHPVSSAEAPHFLNNVTAEEFDQLVHDIFKQRGYSVAEKRDGAYGGVDLVLQRNNESTYVQYQHWKDQEVDVTDIGELYVAMEFDGVKHGIVITSGVFNPEALDFSLGKSLMLISGVDLSQMIDALPSAEEQDSQEKSEELMEASTDTVKQEMPELDPLCPICSQNMIKRTAKKGKNAGNTFWGCSQFPNCRGVLPVE